VLAEGNLARRFKYLAVEPKEDAHAALSSSIEHLRQADTAAAGDGCIFLDLEELSGTGAKADFVVMTNVLHEIEPADWCALFAAIDAVLAENGSLVVVEDQQLPRGEFAHSSGFIVLGVQELRILFAADDIDLVPCLDERYRSRLVGARIRKDQLTGVSSTTTRRALKCLQERCVREAKSTRQDQTDTSSGNRMRRGWRMAFLCVQAVNATHALQDSCLR